VLTALDEALLHQVPLPFSAAATTDHRFYDRCWVAAYDPGGGTALNLGLGIYKNMNVADGFCCLVHGARQRNFRTSRALRPDLDVVGAGPLRYSVVDPYRHIRVDIAPGAHGIAGELDWRAAYPPFVENPTVTAINGRTATDVQRYDQAGTVDGWLTFGDERLVVEKWFGARDHSWGVRGGVGGFEPVTGPSPIERGFLITWILFATDEMTGYVQRNRDGTGTEIYCDGRLRWRDGRPDRTLHSVEQEIDFPRGSRYYTRASMQFVDSEGDRHEIAAERLTEPIVMRGAGYDGGFDDGKGLGVYRGETHLEFDEFDLSTEGRPVTVPDGRPVPGQQRGQPVGVTVDGLSGVGELSVIALGDCSYFGVDDGGDA
jgi:hypothetical protein